MGKDGELWDDSALIKAFDTAFSKYKMMHGMTEDKNIDENFPAENGSSNQVDFSTAAEHVQNMETKEELDSSNIQDGNITPTNEIPAAKSDSQGEHTISSDAETQNEANQSSYEEEYYILWNKYYEIENQRQQIIHQIYTLNQQFPSSTTPTAQAYRAPVAQPYATDPYAYDTVAQPYDTVAQPYANVAQPYDTVAQPYATVAQPYGCSHDCQLVAIPCLEIPRGSRNRNSTSPQVPDFVKTTMVAAERALSLTKEANGEKDQQRGMEIGQIPESNVDTDLQVVLNAWYSAGFHTGKYVSRQSSDMRKHDQEGV